jgi:serine/threonine-protein kinase
MGVVFEAQHLRLYRRVAVKVLPSDLIGNWELLVRFQQEAELASRIQHPNVVSIIDNDVTPEGQPYLVMELLQGENLAERLARSSPLPTNEAVAIASQIAMGLGAAHRADIVHRDLKPENVFLTSGPDQPLHVKLLDFGIGRSLRASRRLTGAAMILGTPEYMAPEQAAGLPVDARTDQYGLAVLTYEMLTGTQPFAHDEIAEALRRVATLVPSPPSHLASWLSPEIDAVVLRALAKDPKERFPDVATFVRALVHSANRPRRSGVVPTVRGSDDARSAVLDDTRVAERALEALDMPRALRHAESAFDAVGAEAFAGGMPLATCEPVLCRVFLQCLGTSDSVLSLRRSEPIYGAMSPRSFYLLSRIENGIHITDALDVSGMTRLETLRRLVQLVRAGMVGVQ